MLSDQKKEPITSGLVKQAGNEIEHPTDFVRNEQSFIEPITSGLAKQAGNEIEHPTGFVRNKQSFIEEEEEIESYEFKGNGNSVFYRTRF